MDSCCPILSSRRHPQSHFPLLKVGVPHPAGRVPRSEFPFHLRRCPEGQQVGSEKDCPHDREEDTRHGGVMSYDDGENRDHRHHEHFPWPPVGRSSWPLTEHHSDKYQRCHIDTPHRGARYPASNAHLERLTRVLGQ